MKQDKLSKWLKFIIIGVGLCGLVVYAFVVPSIGQSFSYDYPEFSGYYLPWIIFISLTSVPVLVALCLCWKIADNIGNDMSFSMNNANYLKWISWLAAGDCAYFFLGNLILTFLNMNHPGILLISLMVIFLGISVSIAAAALSHLVLKAAVLQEQSDLTI